MLEIYRVPEPDETPGLPELPLHLDLCGKQLPDVRGSWAFDRFNGAQWLDVNVGVEPYVMIDSFREGTRVLPPLARHDRWPAEIADVEAVLEAVVKLCAAAAVPEGTEIKLYIPPLRRAGAALPVDFMISDSYSRLCEQGAGLQSGLKFRVIASGRPIILE